MPDRLHGESVPQGKALVRRQPAHKAVAQKTSVQSSSLAADHRISRRMQAKLHGFAGSTPAGPHVGAVAAGRAMFRQDLVAPINRAAWKANADGTTRARCPARDVQVNPAPDRGGGIRRAGKRVSSPLVALRAADASVAETADAPESESGPVKGAGSTPAARSDATNAGETTCRGFESRQLHLRSVVGL
jgi:hypothetical protein